MSEELLKFVCPSCKHTKLECVETNAIISYEVEVYENECFEYGETIIEDSEIDCFQCLNCGYVLKNKEFNVKINENKEVIKWIKENCSQL